MLECLKLSIYLGSILFAYINLSIFFSTIYLLVKSTRFCQNISRFLCKICRFLIDYQIIRSQLCHSRKIIHSFFYLHIDHEEHFLVYLSMAIIAK